MSTQVKKRIVAAFGRSTFGNNYPEQKNAVKQAATAVADLVEDGYDVVVTHSNGIQVGQIHTAMTEFHRLDPSYPVAPMTICTAMSQGYIGYDLQNAIRTELISRGIFVPVCTIITQTRVEPFDRAFTHPTKVIGRVMNEQEAKEEEEKGNYVTKVGENQYRRILASPNPISIYEMDAVKALVDAGQIVIAGGGGGIPVLQQGANLRGASAVIEKDLTAGRMAEELAADDLLFLTRIDKVMLNYGTKDETPIDRMTVSEAQEYLAANQFESGSMRPKIEAAINFVSGFSTRRAIIAALGHTDDAIKGRCGTIIVNG